VCSCQADGVMASCLHDLPALRAPSGRRIDGPQDNSRTAAHLASGRPVGSPADRRHVAENVFGNRRCGRGGHGPSWATRVGEARATDRPGSASTGKTARGDPAPCPGAHPGVPIVSQTRSEIHFSSFNTSHKHHPSPQRSHAHTTRGRKRSCWESRRCPVCTKCTQDRAWAGRLGPRANKGRRRGCGKQPRRREVREPSGRGSAVLVVPSLTALQGYGEERPRPRSARGGTGQGAGVEAVRAAAGSDRQARGGACGRS